MSTERNETAGVAGVVESTTTDETGRETEGGRRLLDRFDALTRARLAASEDVATALDVLLDDSGAACKTLDAAMASELAARTNELLDWLRDFRRGKLVREDEDSLLHVRRLERQLEVALDLLPVPREEEKEDARPDRRTRRGRGRGKKGAAKAKAKPARRLTRSERIANKRQAQRRTRLASFCACMAVLTLMSVAWNSMGEATRTVRTAAPPAMLEPGAYLEDARAFVPAADTALMGSTLHVMVEPTWRAVPLERQQEAAQAAHTFFMNRNIDGLVLRWPTGAPIGSFKDDKMAWHDIVGDDASRPPTTSMFAMP